MHILYLALSLSLSSEKLTRRHVLKLNPAVQCSVEEAALAVGDIVKSASRMNVRMVIFVESTVEISEQVEKGVFIQYTFTIVSPHKHRVMMHPRSLKMSRW